MPVIIKKFTLDILLNPRCIKIVIVTLVATPLKCRRDPRLKTAGIDERWVWELTIRCSCLIITAAWISN